MDDNGGQIVCSSEGRSLLFATPFVIPRMKMHPPPRPSLHPTHREWMDLPIVSPSEKEELADVSMVCWVRLYVICQIILRY
ncbi:hypothetical protein CEXT_663871 [Caerostris extrusa]|uniref:Uncharacterized protein n=1 Tax=Caerostris extrusa TaxID=172846 RepID=A0AAV4VAT9_CAEEX|nr:hypothetical protein CEXT_663871 [Caerostris extrusa]